VVDGELVDGVAGAVIHGAGLSAPRLELGPISSVLSGVEEEEDGASMLDGDEPKPLAGPPSPADGANIEL
jgi:hypothetical protein